MLFLVQAVFVALCARGVRAAAMAAMPACEAPAMGFFFGSANGTSVEVHVESNLTMRFAILVTGSRYPDSMEPKQPNRVMFKTNSVGYTFDAPTCTVQVDPTPNRFGDANAEMIEFGASAARIKFASIKAMFAQIKAMYPTAFSELLPRPFAGVTKSDGSMVMMGFVNTTRNDTQTDLVAHVKATAANEQWSITGEEANFVRYGFGTRVSSAAATTTWLVLAAIAVAATGV